MAQFFWFWFHSTTLYPRGEKTWARTRACFFVSKRTLYNAVAFRALMLEMPFYECCIYSLVIGQAELLHMVTDGLEGS